MRDVNHLLGGKFVDGTSGRYGEVFNPSTGEQIARVALASADETRDAIGTAEAAKDAWAATSVIRRARIIQNFVQVLYANKDKLAELLATEHGKVFSDAQGEVQRGIEVAEFAAGMPHLLKGEYSDNVGGSIDMHSMRKPLGVCVGISPFNFPVMITLWMSPIAIACGNTFVMKPSEKDPTVVNFLAELYKEAGLPDGVFNVLHGDKEAVDALITDPRVKAVSFVGSTPIAQYIYSTASAHGKRCQAMGGAKNHMIIMPDADLDQVVDALMGAGYGSAGERCMAISAAVAVGNVGDEIVRMLKPKVEELNVGPSMDETSDMGPLVTAQHRDKVRGYIDMGVKEGADLVVDGREFSLQGYENGYFLGGSLFDNVTSDMTSYKDEIFGPVLQVMRVDSFDEAIRLPNEHQYGNGTAIFTRDGDSAREFANRVEVGMVGINVPIPVPLAFHSFGGWKASAYGDMNQHGPEGVRFYTRVKTITTRWPTGIRKGAEFTMPTLG